MYYAYKQEKEADEGTDDNSSLGAASTDWEKMLEGPIA
jgi:hypothetical protein